MGSCMSSKAGKKGRNTRYTTVPAPYANHKKGYLAMDTPDNKQNEIKAVKQRGGPYSRGQATLFGFKRRPTSAPGATPSPTPAPAPVTQQQQQPLDNAAHQKRTAPNLNHKTSSLESLNNVSPVTSGKSSPRLARPAKDADGNNVRTNRFGFRSPVAVSTTNKVGDSNSNLVAMAAAQQSQEYKNLINREKPRNKGGGGVRIVKPIKSGIGSQGLRSPALEPGQRFTLQTSLLPAPQFPIRLASVDSDRQTKGAKTLANNYTKKGSEDSSSNGSLNADSGIGSQRETDGSDHQVTPQDPFPGIIQQLDQSPGNHRRNRRLAGPTHKKRELEMIVSGQSFDVRDIKEEDPHVITEISVIALDKKPTPPTQAVRPTPTVRKPQYQRQVAPRAAQPPAEVRDNQHSSPRSSGEWRDEGLGCEEEDQEEKANRDRCRREKDLMPEGLEVWGQGEAMAEDYSCSEDLTSTYREDVVARPVLLQIEEARFAAIAAGVSTFIEDERSPVDSLISNSLPTSSSSSDNSDDQPSLPREGSPPKDKSPGTPTTSLSLSEGRDRDFLIDDEIADQPGLTFDEQVEPASDLISSVAGLELTENTPTLVETLKERRDVEGGGSSVAKTPPAPPVRRAGSVDTLSPCESLTSDDLMMDFDKSEDSAFNSRVGSNAGLQNDDTGSQTDEIFREWNNLITAHTDMEQSGLLSGRSTRLLRSHPGSTPDSPRSLDSRLRPLPPVTGSPLRPPRQPTSSESDDGGTAYMRIDRTTYQQMCQDIVSMKTMLLKLKRLFQEDGENGLTRAETLNPFDNTLKNGLFYSLGEAGGDLDPGSEVTAAEEVIDLRRQVLFLQQQVDERERTIQLLQLQMTKYSAATTPTEADGEKLSCNAATQTERVRPVSAGPSLLQSLPSESNMGPLVSLSEGWRHRNTPPNARRLSSPTPHRLTSANLVATNHHQHSGIPTRQLQTRRSSEARS